MSDEEFYNSELERVKNNYTRSKHKGFSDKYDFGNWFVGQLKQHQSRCYYCETSIHDINRLIDSGLLSERETGYGWRGRPLEIDKNDEEYTKNLCVLACYYCNNDKSYTISKEHYKQYFGPNRKKYFEELIKQLDGKSN